MEKMRKWTIPRGTIIDKSTEVINCAEPQRVKVFSFDLSTEYSLCHTHAYTTQSHENILLFLRNASPSYLLFTAQWQFWQTNEPIPTSFSTGIIEGFVLLGSLTLWMNQDGIFYSYTTVWFSAFSNWSLYDVP